MKKYPFSKKAVKAMLAASIALSPFAASALSTPVKVEAADFNSVDSLIDYVDRIYDSLDPETDKPAIKAAQSKFNSITETQWNEYAKQISEKGDSVTQDELDILKGILKLFTGVSVLEVKGNINEFKSQNKEDIQKLFGKEVTTDSLLGFITDVQEEFLNIIKGKNLDSTSNSTFEDYITLAVLSAGTMETNEVVFNNFKKVVYVEGAIGVARSIKTTVDRDGSARTALVNALKKVQPTTTTPPVVVPPTTGGPVGGGTIAPPQTNKVEKGNEIITQIPAEKVQEIVNLITEKNNIVPVKLEKVTGDKKAVAEVPANLFSEAAKKNSNAIVSIETEVAVYKLPVSEINVAALAQKLGVAAADVKINVSVNVVKADVKGKVADVVEFKVIAVSGDKQEAITAFSTYVDRVLTGAKEFSKGNSVAVRVNDDGTLTSIPTTFDGNNATIRSLTNSKYTVVENNITFKDVTDKSWAKGYIETLANKLIVKGKETDKYAPADHMTRAEFTVLLVRALGLPSEKYDGKFKDVKGTEWFNENGEIMAAVKHGIIKGINDKEFAPQNKITRAEAAVMIERAMNLSFVNYDKSQLDSKKTVADFKDAGKLQDWNKKAIEAVYQADIVSGRETKEFDPKGNTQRDEMAKILANFLTSAKLMN